MTLIDIGVNLTHKSFNKDRDAVIDNAVDHGVTIMVLTGTSVSGSRRALQLAQSRPGVLYSTAGVHPHDASSCNETTIAQLRELAAHPEVVAIGECGLDFNRDFSPRDVQERWFRAQLELAAELKMPLFLHERDAHDRFIKIMEEHRSSLVAAVVHCFTGTRAQMEAYLEMDLHIGITGWVCDERRGQNLRELVGDIPMNRLMIETDAPFLTPRDMRPRQRRNEPRFLPHIAEVVAGLVGAPTETLVRGTTDTARTFFQLPTP